MINNISNINKSYIQIENNIYDNILEEYKKLPDINENNRNDIAILIKSFLTILYFNKQNIKKVKESFISELSKLGISNTSLANNIAKEVIEYHIGIKNNFFDLFHENDIDLNQNMQNIINIFEVDSQKIIFSNNINSYIRSISILCNEEKSDIKLAIEFLIEKFLSSQTINYDLNAVLDLLKIYNQSYEFDKQLLNLLLKCINYNKKFRFSEKVELIKEIILPCLSNNINLIDKIILQNLLSFTPHKTDNNNNTIFMKLEVIIKFFICHYDSDDKENEIIKFIEKFLIINQNDCYNFLLETLTNLFNKDNQLLSESALEKLVKIFEKNIDYFKEKNTKDTKYAYNLFNCISLYQSQIENNSFNELMNKLINYGIEKIEYSFDYKKFVTYIFNNNNDFISKDNIKNLITCLSKNKEGRIIDEYGAKNLIQNHKKIFTPEELVDLNINLINNCLSIDSSDFDEIKFVEDLIANTLNDNKPLNEKILSDLMDNIRENLNNKKIILMYKYILPNFFDILNLNSNNLLNIIEYHLSNNNFLNNSLIIYFIDILINKHKFTNRLIKFIESKIEAYPSLCISLVEKYANNIILEEKKILIKKIILRMSDGLNLLNNNLELFNQSELYVLIKSIINKYLLSINQNNQLFFDGNINLLNIINNINFKNILLAFEQNFFVNTLNQVTNHYKNHLNVIQELIQMHQTHITPEQITNIYNSTSSISVINYIISIQNNYNIILPNRNDILEPTYGIINNRINNMFNNRINTPAFQIHNYTNGSDGVIIDIIKYFVRNEPLKIDKNQFLENYIKLNKEENNAIINVLNKIEMDINYKEKFYYALPYLVSFLNDNNQNWKENYKEKESRWNIWLELGLIEAAQAYGNSLILKNISCVKGIYERLFTPFRVIHPLFELLFLNQNIVDEFENDINKKLKYVADHIVINDIQTNNIPKKDINIDRINEIFIKNFIKYFNDKKSEAKNNLLKDLELNNEISNLINFELERNLNITTSFIDKIVSEIGSYLDNLLFDNVNFYEYINKQLT
jgi:hypothetical protein